LSIVIRGGPDNYEVVETILIPEKERLVHLELDYVQLDINNFIEALEPTWDTLETLIMTHVRLSGPLLITTHRRLSLRRLKTFVLKLYEPVGPTEDLKLDMCDNCLISNSSKYTGFPFADFTDLDCFYSLILFSKNGYTYSKNIWDMKINFEFSFYDWTFFKLNLQDGELVSMVKESDSILRDIPQKSSSSTKFVLRKLSLKNCDLNISTLRLFSDDLTHLILDNVYITGLGGRRVSEILANFTNLEELTLKNNLFSEYYDAEEWAQLGISGSRFEILSKIPRQVLELSDFPQTLKNLRISDYDLTWNSNSTENSTLNFNLDHLILHRVNILNISIANNFNKLFRVKKLVFGFWDHRIIRPEVTTAFVYWFDVLQEATRADGIEWIFVDSSASSVPSWLPPASEITKMDSKRHKNLFAMRDLLLRAKVPEGSSRFTLDRKSHPSYWEGQELSTSNDAKALWFHFLNMETFVKEDLAMVSRW
jgi:hypothetical protein